MGAHAVGRAYQGRQGDYVEMVCTEMIPEVGCQGLADFVDVFCDEGFFTPVETGKILEAAAIWGMKPKIHANELAVSGGVQVGVEMGAVSVDHLERTTQVEIDILRDSSTVPTIPIMLRVPISRAKIIFADWLFGSCTRFTLPLAISNPPSCSPGNPKTAVLRSLPTL